MNIDKFPNQHNNFCSTLGNNCTKTFDHRNPDIDHHHDHTANIWFVVQLCASPCALLYVLISRFDILHFCGTLLCVFGYNLDITGEFAPTGRQDLNIV
jgi:hypothetical protein